MKSGLMVGKGMPPSCIPKVLKGPIHIAKQGIAQTLKELAERNKR
jgi:hypothetical protein